MEKRLIDFTLEQKLKNNELETVEMLRGVIATIIRKYGDITDVTKEKYNSDPDNKYEIKISVSTIRNYLKPYGYVIKKDIRECIVREIGFPEYLNIRKKIDALDDNNKDAIIETTKSVPEQLALGYVAKAEYFKDQKQQSIRFSTNVQQRLGKLYTKYGMFTKQYLLSYLLSTALESLGE
jgi:hypothetical protein